MSITHSAWRNLVIALLIAGGVVWLYEARVFDSRSAAPDGRVADPAPPGPGDRLQFSATAYCKGTTTASGVNVRSGIVAADPQLLPVGSVIKLDAPGTDYDGVYSVLDTGPKVQGRHVDVYMWSCTEALEFGRRGVNLVVLRLGWSPANSAPGLIERMFRRREAQRTAPDPEPTPDPAASDADATASTDSSSTDPSPDSQPKQTDAPQP